MKKDSQISIDTPTYQPSWQTGVLTPGSVPPGGDRYSTLLDNALVWILELNLDGKLIGSNLCGMRALDVSNLARVINAPFRNHLSEEHRADFDQLMVCAQRGFAGELEFSSPSGRWFSASFVPVKDCNGTTVSIMGLAQEITLRKMAENNLAQKELLLREVAEHINEAFWSCDPHCSQVLYLSPGFEVIWGIAREVILADPERWIYCIHPEDRDRVVEARKGQSQGKFDETYRILRPDGEVRWIRDRAYPILNAAGEVYRLTGIAEDITSRKAAESALIASEERYRGFFNTMRDGLVFISDNGAVEDANPAFLDLFGYSLEELEQARYSKLTPQSWLEWEEAHVTGQVERRGHSDTYEKEMIRKSGEVFSVSAQCWLLKGDGDEFSGMLVQIRDLSRSKHMELERQRLESQLFQVQKMETIGILAGGIAHDFNNILTPILGFARMAKEDEGQDQQSDLDQVIKAANRARELVKQILSFSRQCDPIQEPVNIYAILRETSRLLRSTLPATIDVKMKASNRKDVVSGNATQLIQVFMNLGTNAFHAMRDERGLLEFSSQRLEINETNRPSHPNLTGGSWVKVTVRDTGRGMEPELVSRIFEAFFTTKAVGQGTGLGLSVVHNIIESHCGVITVSSKPGEGTTFHIHLPLASTNEVAEPIEPEAQPGNERILMVDDEATITLMVSKMLSRMGYQVKTSNDSIAALATFRADPFAFDMLITDQVMPRMTGLELCRKVKELRPELPILIITGYSEHVTPDSCFQVGVHDYLIKPILAADMSKAIRAAFDARQG